LRAGGLWAGGRLCLSLMPRGD